MTTRKNKYRVYMPDVRLPGFDSKAEAVRWLKAYYSTHEAWIVVEGKRVVATGRGGKTEKNVAD